MTFIQKYARPLMSAAVAMAAALAAVAGPVAAHADERGFTEPVAVAADHGVEVDALTVETDYGIPVRNQQRFQEFVDETGYVVDVRPTNPDSVRWLEIGGLPKPQFLKSKTINDIDVLLGARDGFQGTVGFFEPVMPATDMLPTERRAAVENRFVQRWNEYQELTPTMDRLVAEGVVTVTDGVVFGTAADGSRKPFTGDHDVYDIRTVDGARLPQQEYDAAVSDMIARDMGVQHGAHLYWEPATSFEQDIYQRIVDSHQPGGEPLVRFAPGVSPRLVDATTPIAG